MYVFGIRVHRLRYLRLLENIRILENSREYWRILEKIEILSLMLAALQVAELAAGHGGHGVARGRDCRGQARARGLSQRPQSGQRIHSD